MAPSRRSPRSTSWSDRGCRRRASQAPLARSRAAGAPTIAGAPLAGQQREHGDVRAHDRVEVRRPAGARRRAGSRPLQSCGTGTGSPARRRAPRPAEHRVLLAVGVATRAGSRASQSARRSRGSQVSTTTRSRRRGAAPAAAPRVVRVVDGEHGHRGVERVVGERQPLGARATTRRGVARALARTSSPTARRP